jgi:hypothetical protein
VRQFEHLPDRLDDYAKASTPLAKAKVAVALLKEVVRTDGQCLGE